MINLPTCLDINAECDNEPCEFSHDRKCTFYCRQWKHISPDTQNNPESLPEPEWILPQKRLDELNEYFNNHKDDLIRIAWKNMRDDIHLYHKEQIQQSVVDKVLEDIEGFVDAYSRFEGGYAGGTRVVNVVNIRSHLEELREGKDGEPE